MTDVVVVGGGLAGLVAARRVAADGRDVTLFEREETIGGRVRSRHEDGFVFDRGFQVLFTAYPAVQDELDLDALDLRSFRPGATIAQPGERTTLSDPFGDPRALTATLFNRDVTLGDKLRVFRLRREMARKPIADILAEDHQSVEAFLDERGFSEQFRENFAAPFYGGITLDRTLATSRLVFEYTFKMLTEGQAAVPAEGMGAITTQLAEQARAAGVTIETGELVESVDWTDRESTVETASKSITAEAAIVATDPQSAQELTGVDAIPTAGRACVTQHFSLPTTQKLRTGKRLLLNAVDDRPNQIAPMSAAAPEYAPTGKQLLSATFLGEQSASDEELAREVQETLASWYPENRFENLELLRTDRIPFAQLAQPPGFTDDQPAVDTPEGEVYLAGDYTEWSSIQGAMESGRRAAMAVK